jgi:thiosulfate/3-mercaptopyruvate sulfurtransferase
MNDLRRQSIFWPAVAAIMASSILFLARSSRPASFAAQTREPWSHDEVMTPEELVKGLANPRAQRPAVVCVGFEFLYEGAHVPGALLLGPGRESKGIEDLTHWAHGVARDKEVVLYCGCCPWTQCPNIRPAYRALHTLGFRHLKVVEIDQDFAHDWVAKGYPVEKGK